MLGVSGMRGIVGASMTPPVALRYAAAFAEVLREQAGERPTVLVGRDGRLGGEPLEQAAIAGLLAGGCQVVGLGVASTPTIGYAASASQAHGALIVTASHNPQEWNGLKLLVRVQAPVGPGGAEQGAVACAPPADLARRIIDRFHAREDWSLVPSSASLCWESHWPQAHRRHVDALVRAVIPHDAARAWRSAGTQALRCVLDAVNASGSTVGVPFLDGFGDVLALHASGSGRFPHTPEPTQENLSGPGQLCDIVPAVGASVGFAQDPDADRLAIVDQAGRYIGEELTLVLAAQALLEQEPDPAGAVLVANLSTSRMIDDLAERFGAQVHRTPVGEAHVAQRMLELLAQGRRVLLGGEGNGGVIWPAVSFVRDSISAMGLTLSLMARHQEPLGAIVDGLPRYAILKRKQPLRDRGQAQEAIGTIADHFASRGRIDRQDGVRIDLDDQRAWLSVRASNTEPILRLIAEAPTPRDAQALLDQAQSLLG
ncbi:MAG: phosphomannomutase [Phycisphaerales bacterium]|nr:MAG: phosphomannomutase [Phycisphaerales bacterium]